VEKQYPAIRKSNGNKNNLVKMNKKMKIAKFIFLSLLAGMLLSACAKHDFLDDLLITGNVGPQAYWSVGSATVTAGTNMPFMLQYYTTGKPIDRSEVWYDVVETQEKSVICPWVKTFTYSVISSISEEKRVSQKIQEYPNSLAVWSDSLHAYVLQDAFPVSNTLNRFTWSNPVVFDYDLMNTYFGTGFMQQFKDSLQSLMQFADYKNMLLGLGLLSDFNQYTDSTLDVNSGAWVYHFPTDANGNTPVPAEINALFADITFDQLIQGSPNYNVSYIRRYTINAVMRVYDINGVYSATTSQAIDVN